jgi:hypothetical protein
VTIIRPETLIRWHRSGFCFYWRWKSRFLGGQPPIEARLRALIRQMSKFRHVINSDEVLVHTGEKGFIDDQRRCLAANATLSLGRSTSPGTARRWSRRGAG